MALTYQQKEAVVAEVKEVASKAISAVVVNYRGLTVEQMTTLRANARKQSVHLQVVPNRLAKIALAKSDFECLNDSLTGPLLLAFSLDAPGAAARVVKDFRKENELLGVVALAMNSELLEADRLDAIASLPTLDEARAMLMSVMKAPVTKFVQTLEAPVSKLVRTVAAVRDQKQAA